MDSKSSDLIRRGDAIETAKDWYNGLIVGSFNGLEKRLKALPSAQPEQKKGKWVFKNDMAAIPTGYYECSECKSGRLIYKENFCPNCGADMRGEENA